MEERGTGNSRGALIGRILVEKRTVEALVLISVRDARLLSL